MRSTEVRTVRRALSGYYPGTKFRVSALARSIGIWHLSLAHSLLVFPGCALRGWLRKFPAGSPSCWEWHLHRPSMVELQSASSRISCPTARLRDPLRRSRARGRWSRRPVQRAPRACWSEGARTNDCGAAREHSSDGEELVWRVGWGRGRLCAVPNRNPGHQILMKTFMKQVF
eukprot:SAG31_NODE_3253_length_4489_cov_3.514351_2_plen_173_part_00